MLEFLLTGDGDVTLLNAEFRKIKEISLINHTKARPDIQGGGDEGLTAEKDVKVLISAFQARREPCRR